MKMRVVFVVLSLWLVALGASAQEGVLRFGAQGVFPTEDASETVTWTRVLEGVGVLWAPLDMRVDVDNGAGFSVGYEYKFNPRVGMEFSLSYTQNDLLLQGEGDGGFVSNPGQVQNGSIQVFQSGELTMIPLTLGANYHFFPDRPLDLYLGGFLGYVFFDDLQLDGERINLEFIGLPPTVLGEPETVAVESDATYGAILGVDLSLGASAWVFNASARYSRISATVRDDNDQFTLNVHPVTLQMGVGYRF
jgi:outer membrane protein W